MTIERLLRPSPALAREFEGMAQTKQDSGLPFRLAETNSCYQGGKRGVSDTFASALWGADLMYQLATAGGVGHQFPRRRLWLVHTHCRNGSAADSRRGLSITACCSLPRRGPDT